jgi:hypothetical protein
VLALPLAAQAQEQTPQQFLQSIYDPYRTAGFKGQPYWEAKRFFAPDLAQAIERDVAEAKKRKEPPTLDGDPFVDAQDWQITSISSSTSVNKENTKAAGAVAFLNSGEPKAMAIAMVKMPAGWRISDITGPSGSLRGLYKLK